MMIYLLLPLTFTLFALWRLEKHDNKLLRIMLAQSKPKRKRKSKGSSYEDSI